MTESIVLTPQIMIVFALLGLAVVLFVFDLLRVDLVGILMMVLLPLSGIISGQEALAGLSSNAVVSIIAVMIIGAGLNRTGVMTLLARKITRLAGKNEIRIMLVISTTVSAISSFMQNIGAAALFLPAATRISQRLKVPISKILMPMGFSAIVGGCLTMVGSSPLIMLNDVMKSWWLNQEGMGQFVPFGLFSVTPFGAALLAGCLLYFVITGRFVLPKVDRMEEYSSVSARIRVLYGKSIGKGFGLVVPADFKRATLEELRLRPRFHATVIGIASRDGNRKNLAPTPDSVIEPGDQVALACTPEHVEQLAAEMGWEIFENLDVFSEDLSPDNVGVVEGVIPNGSNMAGRSMDDLKFRTQYHTNALAIVRGSEVILDNINVSVLRPGDSLLLEGPWEKFHLIKQQMGLVFIDELRGEVQKPEKAGLALMFLGLALVLAMGFKVQLSIALLTGALGMILTRVLHIDEAYAAVDWMTIFLLAGLIPLGGAFEKSGAAQYLAVAMIGSFGTMSPLVFMGLISVLTSFFSLVASNVGATVLMVPLAMNMAMNVGADPRACALVVAISASNTFILPTHQVNALIMRPGGYKTLDYIKAGTGMTILYLLILLGMVAIVF